MPHRRKVKAGVLARITKFVWDNLPDAEIQGYWDSDSNWINVKEKALSPWYLYSPTSSEDSATFGWDSGIEPSEAGLQDLIDAYDEVIGRRRPVKRKKMSAPNWVMGHWYFPKKDTKVTKAIKEAAPQTTVWYTNFKQDGNNNNQTTDWCYASMVGEHPGSLEGVFAAYGLSGLAQGSVPTTGADYQIYLDKNKVTFDFVNPTNYAQMVSFQYMTSKDMLHNGQNPTTIWGQGYDVKYQDGETPSEGINRIMRYPYQNRNYSDQLHKMFKTWKSCSFMIAPGQAVTLHVTRDVKRIVTTEDLEMLRDNNLLDDPIAYSVKGLTGFHWVQATGQPVWNKTTDRVEHAPGYLQIFVREQLRWKYTAYDKKGPRMYIPYKPEYTGTRADLELIPEEVTGSGAVNAAVAGS